MPVNNFEFEKADGIISSIKGQSVGRDPISAAAIFNFVSIAQKGFGYEPEEDFDMIAIVYKDINDDYQIVGDFDKCLEQLKAQKPFVAIASFYSTIDTSGNATFSGMLLMMEVSYDISEPERIVLRDTSTTGWNWTADNLERFE